MGTYQTLKEALEQELRRAAGLPELRGPDLERLLDKLRQNRFNLVIPPPRCGPKHWLKA